MVPSFMMTFKSILYKSSDGYFHQNAEKQCHNPSQSDLKPISAGNTCSYGKVIEDSDIFFSSEIRHYLYFAKYMFAY